MSDGFSKAACPQKAAAILGGNIPREKRAARDFVADGI
jgi:hypothetical protein